MANLAKNYRHKKNHSDWCQITSHGLRPLNLHCREKKKKEEKEKQHESPLVFTRNKQM
jgi:hypothetical protein